MALGDATVASIASEIEFIAESYASNCEDTVGVEVQLKFSCQTSSKPFPLWGPGWWSQTPRDAFPTTQYGIDDKVENISRQGYQPNWREVSS